MARLVSCFLLSLFAASCGIHTAKRAPPMGGEPVTPGVSASLSESSKPWSLVIEAKPRKLTFWVYTPPRAGDVIAVTAANGDHATAHAWYYDTAHGREVAGTMIFQHVPVDPGDFYEITYQLATTDGDGTVIDGGIKGYAY